SFVGRTGASASPAEWIVSAVFSRARKAGTDAGAHRRNCRRRKSGVGGITGYASRRRVCGAALRTSRAQARSKCKKKRKRTNERGDCPAPGRTRKAGRVKSGTLLFPAKLDSCCIA